MAKDSPKGAWYITSLVIQRSQPPNQKETLKIRVVMISEPFIWNVSVQEKIKQQI